MTNFHWRETALAMSVAAALVALISVAVADVDEDERSFDLYYSYHYDDDEDEIGRLERGNVIFFHPDGSALQQWNAARMYWYGQNDLLNWDELPWMAVCRGYMADRLTGTSNGGATTHAFGYKVTGPNSYGTDNGRDILALSGYPGSISREAANNRHPTGLVNDGDIAGEPGTGTFFAETDTHGEPEFQSLQLLGGRPGFNGFNGNPEEDPDITDGEEDPVVILGGGERFFLPKGSAVARFFRPSRQSRTRCPTSARWSMAKATWAAFRSSVFALR